MNCLPGNVNVGTRIWGLLTFLLPLLIIRMPGMQFYLWGWRRSENTRWITLPRGEGVQESQEWCAICVPMLLLCPGLMSRHLRVQCPHNYSPHSPLIWQHLRISPDGNPAFTDVNNNNSDSAAGTASWMWQLFVRSICIVCGLEIKDL